MRLKNAFLLIFLLIVTISFFSCADDNDGSTRECLEEDSLGQIMLAEGSRDFLPFPDVPSVFIFSDSIGNEIRATYTPSSNRFCTVNTSYILDANAPERGFCFYDYQGECINSSFAIDSINLELIISGRVEANINENDDVELRDKLILVMIDETPIIPGAIEAFNDGFLSLSLDERNSTSDNTLFAPVMQENFSLHGRRYENVYVPTLEFVGSGYDNNYNIYWSDEVGIVGFENENSTVSFKFERIQ